MVWDSQHHKVLLHSTGVMGPGAMSFSSDGCFFVCGTQGREFHIWKESPTGYASHQKLVSGAEWTIPLVSPNGESVILPSSNMIQLWHIANSSASLSSTLIQASQHNGDFCVEFPPDESLVAFTDMLGRTVIILDMKSGNPWLAIDTGTRICGLKMTEDTIIVVGYRKIMTWDLPARGCVENTRRNIKNSIHTTTFKWLSPPHLLHASISPNLNYIAIEDSKGSARSMGIYDMCSGKKLDDADSHGRAIGFTSNNRFWCANKNGKVRQWEIVKKDGSDAIKLNGCITYKEGSKDYYWNAPDGHQITDNGHQITDNGWIISPSGKQLLWLPPHLQPGSKVQRKWSGKFLAVWNGSSPEPCILDFGA